MPEIQKDLGLEVQLLVVGTGQAIRLGKAGDVDAILVHSQKAEEAFIASGNGTHRTEIMYNDFVLIGPASDPAGIAGAGSADEALMRIATAETPFVSRGDDSGTHKKERALWAAAGVSQQALDVTWYKRSWRRHGGGAEHSVGHGRLYYVRSRQLAKIWQQRRLGAAVCRRPCAVQPIWLFAGKCCKHGHVKKEQAERL